MSELRPVPVVALGGSRNKDNETIYCDSNQFDESSLPGISQQKLLELEQKMTLRGLTSQVSEVWFLGTVLGQLFFRGCEFDVEDADEESKNIGRTSGPGLDIQIGHVISIGIKISHVSGVLVGVVEAHLHGVGERNSYGGEHGDEGPESAFRVDEKDEERSNEYLHIVLEVPPPPHALAVPIVHQIVHEQQGLPHALAVLQVGSILEPEWPRHQVRHHRVVQQDGYQIRRYKTQIAIKQCQRVAQFGFNLILFKDRVANQEPTYEEECVHRKNGSLDNQLLPRVQNLVYRQDI